MALRPDRTRRSADQTLNPPRGAPRHPLAIRSDPMKKWTLLAMALVFTLSLGLAQADEAKKTLFNDKCPISGADVNPEKTSDYKVEFCCKNCKAKFDKNPAKHLEKAAEGEEGKCIFNGRPAKTSSTLTIGFCCGNCKGKFDEDPDKFITKAKPAKAEE
jgi:YHS domain-containing protein